MDEPLRVLSDLPVHPHRSIDPEQYRLRVDGLARERLTLSLNDLQVLARAVLVEDFTCLEGWVVPGQQWAGIPLDAVLRAAEPAVGARWVQASCAEFGVPLAIDRASDVLLALSLNGAPLTPEHGAPVRVVVRGGECFTSVKWVDHLELTAEPLESTGERIARERLAIRD